MKPRYEALSSQSGRAEAAVFEGDAFGHHARARLGDGHARVVVDGAVAQPRPGPSLIEMFRVLAQDRSTSWSTRVGNIGVAGDSARSPASQVSTPAYCLYSLKGFATNFRKSRNGANQRACRGASNG